MSRSEKKRRNVLAVIEMFANVGLPVCNDEQAIKAKRDEQRDARNRELNSTKGTSAARAQQWFDDVDALLNRREKLLQVVFEEFCGLADTALRAGLDGGRDELGADTQIALRDLAMSWCRARSDLANEWLERFQERRGLVKGGAVEQTQPVENLRVSARSGRVTLRWDVPAEGCDSVKIVRAPDPAGDKSDEVVVYEGKESGYVDSTIVAKQHYTYRVHSVYHARTSLRSEQISTQRKASERKLAIPLAACVLIALAGVVGWDLQRDGSLLRTLNEPEAPAGVEQAAELTELEDAPLRGPGFGPVRDLELHSTPAPATDAAAIERAQELAERLAAGEHEDLTSVPARQPEVVTKSEPEPDASTKPEPPEGAKRAPPTAAVHDSPTLAFSGQTLLIELNIDRPLQPSLVEPALSGVRLRGLDLDRSPGVVRLYVNELPEGDAEGEAFWSFRLADAQGLETGTIAGRCLVLRPKNN
ncbi:MAG: hypothetical protein DHS20C15_07820 [Planctomycetota bacterium]|nr:MAG: hypothetical protein DHS20C15_07820 [Planctomycetota bacterium]